MLRFLRITTIVGPISLLVWAVTFITIWSFNPHLLPLTNVTVVGPLRNISLQEVGTSLLEEASNSSLLWLNLARIRQKLKTLPGVGDIKLRRVFPNSLEIELAELTPLARFNNLLLSTSGELFKPKVVRHDLPLFIAEEEQAGELAASYQEFIRVLSPLGLNIKQLELTSSGVLKLLLDNNLIVILGGQETCTRLKRFAIAYKNYLSGASHKVAYVDLRYTNGIAIGWKTGIN